MIIIKFNQEIQLWNIARCSIIMDGKTLNHDIQDTQSNWLHMVILFESLSIILTLTYILSSSFLLDILRIT